MYFEYFEAHWLLKQETFQGRSRAFGYEDDNQKTKSN